MSDTTKPTTSFFGGAVTVDGGRVQLHDAAVLTSAHMDALVHQAVFGNEGERTFARWLVWELGQTVGVRAASIHELYIARGQGKCRGFTVPAMNIRALAYDTTRAIFRTANTLQAGAFILEIARSEIAYTDQRPDEYVSVILAAALREGYRGPVFIQGDHFQVNHKKFAVDPITEVNAVKALVTEAVAAGFYNIDVDTSTLVDLSKETLAEQQRLNYDVCVDITRFVRAAEPAGVTISIGGEIGEVGTENSTPEELEAFMDGFNATLEAQAPGTAGLSKISVQSGTSHGGIVLADGSIAEVALDLDTLEKLSKVGRDRYGMAGAVQHGASTLPDELFHRFPAVETAEIHLATGFQNALYEHPAFPNALMAEIEDWLRINAADERKDGQTEDQFIYTTRKKAIGPFKRQLWDLAEKDEILAAQSRKIGYLFTELRVNGSMELVERYVRPVPVNRPLPAALAVATPR